MRRDALMVLIGMCVVVCLGASGAREQKLHFPVQKFSIAPLESDLSEGTRTALVMSVPPVNGSAPNVNVRVEAFKGSIDDYLDMSKQQFAKLKFEIIRCEKIDANTAVMEYTGTLNDKSFHWFGRVEVNSQNAYLATGTAAADQWDSVSAKLIACVNSIKPD